MRIELKLKTLKSSNKNLKKGFLKVHFDQKFKICSGQSQCLDGMFVFLQNNTMEVQRSTPQYVSFDLYCSGELVARVSKFCTKVIQENITMLKAIDEKDKSTYQLSYQLKIVQITKTVNGIKQKQVVKVKKRTTIEQENPTEQLKKSLRYGQLTKITYSFSKRLDPVVSIDKQIRSIMLWKKPQLTIAVGVALTLFVLYPKISICVLSICLMFGRKYIIDYVQRLNQADMQRRLLVPQQNLQFLKNTMQFYCNIFQKITQYLQEDDRTKIINIVEIICKFGAVIIVLDLIFSLQTMLIMFIWAALMSTSQTGQKYVKSITSQMLNYNRHLNKLLKNVSKSAFVQVLKPSESVEIFKEFYFFQHQRWWVGTQWGKKKYSDQKSQLPVIPRMEAPLGWSWIDDWKVQFHPEADSQGFLYANGIFDVLNPKFGKKDLQSTIRRRKWIRICKINTQFQNDLAGSKAKQTNTPAKLSRVKQA